MICTPILVRHVSEVPAAMQAAAPLADWLELRLDYLEDLDVAHPLPALNELLAECPRPVLLTLRPEEQGGNRSLSLAERWSFWQQAFGCPAEMFDIEADLAQSHLSRLSVEVVPWEKIIVSWHDFEGTPGDLPGFVKQHFPACAHTLKLATRTRTPGEVVSLFQLLENITKDRRAIVIGMGAAGALTRILGPAQGSFLTYSAAADGRPSAPGQFTAKELHDMYHIETITPATCVTGLMGKPVGHSISPHMHNAAFYELGLDWVYAPVEVQDDGNDLREFVRRFVHPRTRQVRWDTRGYSVTIPHKLNVLPLVDRLTGTAQGVGAVNTLIVNRNELIGDNTDATGAMRPLERACTLRGAQVAVLGAGGAAYAMAYGLVKRGAEVTVFSRNPQRGARLAQKFGVPDESLEDFDGRNFDGLINTTPVGMHGFHSVQNQKAKGKRQKAKVQNSTLNSQLSTFNSSDESPIEAEKLRGLQWVYDVIYTPRETRLLREARGQGILCVSGLEMLIEQAGLQFEVWTGQTAPLSVMRAAAEAALLVGASPASPE